MAKKTISDDDYRLGFEKYLESLPENRRVDIGFLEIDLMNAIRLGYDTAIQNVFSIRDTNYFNHALIALRQNPDTKQLFAGRESKYLKGIRLLDAFFDSNFRPGRKLKSNPRKRNAEESSGVHTGRSSIPKTTSKPEPKTHTEGARKEMEMERAYRNREARNECIRIWGAQCQVCGIRFKDFYGEELGDGFIEVHHLVPISTRAEEYEIDPKKDLVPLCSNCHSMIHRGESGPLSLAELRDNYTGPYTPIDNLMMP